MDQFLADAPGECEEITTYKAIELVAVLEDSVDFPQYSVTTDRSLFENTTVWREHFIDFLYDLVLSDEFVDSIRAGGIKVPVFVRIEQSRKTLANGHHRLAAGLRYGVGIPVSMRSNVTAESWAQTSDCRLPRGRV